ncbi:MAG: hypothetical protein Q8P41_05285 [Pseudomonadota bacterium]|nr:hypothetical protein [Pseudomonadota bacterium]
MTRTLLTLSLLSACSTASIKLADDTSAALTEDDTATAGDDTAADTAEDEPVYAPDYSVWDATRRFYYDNYGYECDETVVEVGDALDEGTSTYDALHDLCGICDYFYEVTPDRDSACDWISLGTTWRGVVLSDDAAAVYFYREADGGVEEYASDEGAAFDGTTIAYAYAYEYGGGYFDIEVSGSVVYPLVEQE